MRYALVKTGQFLITLWAAVTLNFILPRVMPGDPVEAALGKIAQTGQTITPAQKAAIEAQLGVPKGNLISQYFHFLNGIVHLDFGISYTFPTESVAHTIGRALPWTLVLVGMTTVISFIVGTLLGVLAGWRRGTKTDASVTMTTSFAGAFPPFWLALLLLFVLGFALKWFPLYAGYSAGLEPGWTGSFLYSAFVHSILPAAALFVTGLGGWVLGMRNNMINTLGEDYVTFAEANGLRGRTVAVRYAARNALLPNVTAFGLTLASVVGGSVLVEGVFNYPGVGQLLFTAVTNRDFPLMQALFLIITFVTLLAIYIVDMTYVRLDPRVRR